MKLMLDTGVLGMVCHPRKYGDVRLWFRGVLGFRSHTVLIPEIVDFELRRKLLHLGATSSLAALDHLADGATYVPLDTATMRDAAALWARLRARGQPTERDEALGVDVILAAQALRLGATVVTDNARHLERIVDTVAWSEVPTRR
jgi:predicted nucleic acid-binding protein